MPFVCPIAKKAYFKAYYQKNKATWQELYKNNREAILEQKRKDRQERREVYVAREKAWVQNNREKVNAKIARREAAKAQATPKWLTKEHLLEIRRVYKQAEELTKSTGVQYSVDHIIPIRGREAKGLHVPWNLRVIPSTENSKKGNKIYATPVSTT